MGFGTHLCPSPRCIEIPKDLGWRQEVGPGAIKWLPLPPPDLARLWVRARHKRRVVSVPTTLPPPLSALRKRAERRGLWASPRAAGARGDAGASLDAAEAPWGALHAAPSSAHTDWGAEEKQRGKARLTWGARRRSFGLRTRQVSGTAGPGGREALAPLQAGLHFARTGNSPCHPAPRRAPRCHRTERRRHAPHCLLSPGGSLCPPLAVRQLLHRPHPVTSAALHSFLFDTSTGYSAVSVFPPPSAHVLLPLPPL